MIAAAARPAFAASRTVAARNFSSTAARRSGGHGGDGPRENLPFTVGNKYRLAAKMTAFLGNLLPVHAFPTRLGFALPFIAAAWQLSKSAA
ncbi:Cytochrome c oxidase subunit 7C, mitochondrial [Saitoella coloradoensis]